MIKSRVILIFLFVAGLWALLLFRGAYLQLVPNARFEKIKKRQFNRMVRLSSRRGDILDRHGQELAVSVISYSLFADPKIISDPYTVAKRLSSHFKKPFRQMYLKVIGRSRRFVWIKRRLSLKDYKEIKSWNIRGLAFKEEYKRVYPNKTLAASVLGFVGNEQQGLGGLEKKFEDVLSGAGRKVRVQRDARGRVLVEDGRIFASPPEGSDIHLTIDKELQFWVESQLRKAVKENRAKAAWAVVLNPKNSEVLAMASYPSFDANRALKVYSQRRRNKTIHDVYETGSVMKTFSVGGALNHGLVKPNTKINTEGGVFRIGNRKITEADRDHVFKELTVSDILSYSSNVGTSRIALKMTDRLLYQTLLDFGFGQKSGVGLPGEARGILSPPPWRDHLTANISFGHGVAVTALQVANAYAAIANGGELNQPFIVKEIQDVEKGEVTRIGKKTVDRVLTKKNANFLKMMLSSAVTHGSGTQARIHGFPVAGKTGTAQKVRTNGRGYLPRAYIANFAGFVPANDPTYVIYVAIDTPKKKGYYASTVAAPVFRSIAEFALRRDHSTPVFMSEADLVQQKQITGALKPEKKIKQSLDKISDVKEKIARVPDLRGLTIKEVLSHLHGSDLEVQFYGRGGVVKTWPKAGSEINQKLKVYLR